MDMGGQVGGEADPKECPWPLHLAGRFPAWRPELGGTLATAAISWSPAASCWMSDLPHLRLHCGEAPRDAQSRDRDTDHYKPLYTSVLDLLALGWVTAASSLTSSSSNADHMLGNGCLSW